MPYKPKIFVLVQVRTNSSRLFGKCLLPIKKLEMIKILYKRIKSPKYKTVILTSNISKDDYLAKILHQNKIKYFRGDLNNVRDRFLNFSKKLNDKDIIIRCTADNLFVDKFFINYLLKLFLKSKKKYLSIDRKKSSLPYGMIIEIFKIGALRRSVVKNKYDFEHVTPPLKKNKSECEYVIIDKKFNLYNKSCTIDDINDYFKIKFIFENFNNNIYSKWFKLCGDLERVNKRFIKKLINKKFNKIIIGSAQFGYKYGINNKEGNLTKIKIKKILDFATKNYIKFIDTSSNYFNSEKKIGRYILSNKKSRFEIITKFNFPKFKEVKKSFVNLNVKKIFSLLIHNPDFEKKINNFDFFLKKLHEYKKKIKFFGVSLNKPEEYFYYKKKKLFKIFQVPYNILDRRWDKIIKKDNICIHARSIFLQGLLITDEKNYPKKLIPELKIVKKKLNYLVKKYDRYDLKDLLFSYVKSNLKIDKLIIGIENVDQIRELPFYFLRSDLKKSDIIYINKVISGTSNNLINPSSW